MTIGERAVLMWAAICFGGFIGHLVGDYLVQNGWMAANKAKPILRITLWPGPLDARESAEAFRAITIHAVTWAMSVAAFMVTLSWIAWGTECARVAAWACVALGAIHWVQDRRWPVVAFMKATGKDHTQLWLLIVVDNVWHVLQIAAASAFVVWWML